MKKELLTLASAALIFAGCANEDLLENVEPGNVSADKGITFAIADDAATRGDFTMDAEGKFRATWNAESDKISIAYFGVEKNGSGDVALWNGVTGATRFTELEVTDKDLSTAVATYKATRSGRTGYFTADKDENILTFATGKKASFRVFRSTVDLSTANDLVYSSTDKNIETMKLKVAAFDAQTQESTKAPFDNFVMVADTIGNINSDELAVGESLNLSFERVFSGLAFKTKGYDKDVFGKLTEIKITMGSSNIAWTAAGGTVDIAKKVDGKWAYNDNSTATAGKDVTLTINALEWSDTDYAFMQILPVTRSAEETYKVECTFDNGTVTFDNLKSKKNWEANNFYTVELDLTKQANIYLATENTLIVNSGDVPTQIIGQSDLTAITKFVSRKAKLSVSDMAELKKSYTGITDLILADTDVDALGTNMQNIVATPTNLTSLTLTAATTAPVFTAAATMTLACPEVTEIPASAYEGNTTISKYYFPKVKTIGEKAFKGATLTTIGCADEDLIIGTTDAAGNKTSSLTTIGANALEGITGLIEIDAPALTSFGNTPFGYNTSLAFEKVLLPKYDWSDPLTAALLTQGTAMKEIDLSGTSLVGNGINLSSKINLAKVILKPNTAISEDVFKSSGTNIAELKIENINKITSVGKDAFSGCSTLASDIKFENTIATIAAGAFNGTAIKSFDFTGITTIGEGAFQGATALTSIVVPSVTTLEKNVFNGASVLANVTLSNVTTIKEGALNGLASGAQIILPKVLTNIDPKAFSTASLGGQAGTEAAPIIVGGGSAITYNLLINKSQTGVKESDNTLTWKAADGKWYKATFTKITAVF